MTEPRHHDALRRDLAPYTLGALPPGERTELDEHLEGCADCRDELARFAPIPGLLGRLTEEEVAVDGPPSVDLEDRLVGAAVRRWRRQLRVWRTAAVGAAAAAVLVLGLWTPWARPAGTPFHGAPVAQEASASQVVAFVEPREWGMFVTVEVEGLPERPGYALYAVGDDGHEVRVASWQAVDGPTTIQGSCYMAADEAVELRIVSGPHDEVLTTIPLTGQG